MSPAFGSSSATPRKRERERRGLWLNSIRPALQVKPRTRLPLKFEEVAIAAGMAAIALITAANVVVRYLTNISFAFTEEYSVVLMVIVTILGTSLAMAGGRHIKIEYFTDLLQPRGRQIAEIVAMAAGDRLLRHHPGLRRVPHLGRIPLREPHAGPRRPAVAAHRLAAAALARS